MDHSELLEIANSCVNEPWGLGDPFLHSSESQPAYYRFLHHVVATYKPTLVLECGVYMAIASAHMARGCETTKVIGIDKNPHSKAYTASLLYSNFYLVIGDTTSRKVYDEVKASYGSNIGLLFLDSEHDGYTAHAEYALWKSLCANEFLVACDDILDPRMKTFWEELEGDKLEMNFLHVAQYPSYPEPGFGVSIVRKHGSEI